MPSKSKKTPEATSEPVTLNLGMLKPAKGSTKTKLRVGRGRASGAGKTANRGHNGEGQRSGQSSKRGFEGGQMPGYRQMPKINGFRLVNPYNWLEINVGDVESLLMPEETEVTYELLREWGILKIKHDGVRLLGDGDITRKVNIQAHHVTPSAKTKIEAAGGSIELIVPAVSADN
ncbi:MAG: 50S ribosomal protein L15 [Cyanobacteria bacterium]|nr:50S ribosomal protein L15 [Cyanobacteriota bacterium]